MDHLAVPTRWPGIEWRLLQFGIALAIHSATRKAGEHSAPRVLRVGSKIDKAEDDDKQGNTGNQKRTVHRNGDRGQQ